MLIAEIRRKLLDLDDIDERDGDLVDQLRRLLSTVKEDLLTADVFGALKYLPRWPYLGAVLQTVASRHPQAEELRAWSERDAADLAHWAIRFWTSYSTPVDVHGGMIEPDVEISSAEGLIFVEAKLYSGFGSQQIEKQLLTGLEQAGGKPFYLILVTRSSRPPRFGTARGRLGLSEYLQLAPDLPEEAASRVRANAHRVCWTSWQDILSAMQGAHQRHEAAEGKSEPVRCAHDLLTDLNTLMAMRRIWQFRGVGRGIAEPPSDGSCGFRIAGGRQGDETGVRVEPDELPEPGATAVMPSFAPVVEGRDPQAIPGPWLGGTRTRRRRLDLNRLPAPRRLSWQLVGRRPEVPAAHACFAGFRSVGRRRTSRRAGWNWQRRPRGKKGLSTAVRRLTFRSHGLQLHTEE